MVAVALGTAVAPKPLLRPFLVTGVVCAVLPDIDAVGRILQGGWDDIEALGGHRGFTHSLAAAALAGFVAASATAGAPRWAGVRVRFGLFVALVTAAHGALDALTAIGAVTSPVQFFSPFSTRGYVSPWQPITGPFSELVLVVLPLFALTRLLFHFRRFPWPRRLRAVTTLGLSPTSEWARSRRV
jgi:membrane-bound metal-dependent hydrolase YbcI (DUF457 family)